MRPWYLLDNADEVASPALLVYPDRVGQNLRLMLLIAGGPDRLRPHVKTHKLPELIEAQLALGITKFKCATIAEAEMAARCSAPDVLLAYQPVGPNIARMVQLARSYPKTTFSAIVDDKGVAKAVSDAFAAAGLRLALFVDLDCGMHRSGIAVGPEAKELYRYLFKLPGVKPAGLHAYDGHIHEADAAKREELCVAAFKPVLALRAELAEAGFPVPTLVAGGTPTFPIHARRGDCECSPGTTVLWDFGYANKFADLPFLQAALVFTRVVSKPGPNALCLDLGHKAIAAENPHPRVQFLNLPDAIPTMHSEEHLVVESPLAGNFAIGDALYGVPRHICPTVALHSQAVVVEDGRAAAKWNIAARGRSLSI